MNRWKIAGLGAGALLTIGMGVLCYPTGNAIYGVHINGVNVSGMSQQEIRQVLDAQLTQIPGMMTIQVDDNQTTQVPLRDIGIQPDRNQTVRQVMMYGYEPSVSSYVWHRVKALFEPMNIPIAYALNEPQAEHYLTHLGKSLTKQGTEAYLSVEGDTVVYHPTQVGRQFKPGETLTVLKKQLQEGQVSRLAAVIQETKPDAEREKQLQAMDTVLGTFETHYNVGVVSRSHNIALAAEKVNRVLLQPGDVFSFNEIVGERTAAAGYDDAPVFVNGELVPGIGGGICQVSTTLFNTAMLSGMTIVERTPHFAPVGYAGVGRDATVSYGSLDFKFKNEYTHPVYILTENNNGTLRVTIVGHAADAPQEVHIATHNAHAIAHPVIEKEDLTKDADETTEGKDGYAVQVTRQIVSKNGTERYDTFSSVYDPIPTVIVRGKPKPKEEAKTVVTPEPGKGMVGKEEPVPPMTVTTNGTKTTGQTVKETPTKSKKGTQETTPR